MKLQELPRCNLPRHWYVRLELSFAPRNVHAHITEGACTPCIVGVCVFDCPVFLFSIARLQVIKLNLLPLYYFCMQATNGVTAVHIYAHTNTAACEFEFFVQSARTNALKYATTSLALTLSLIQLCAMSVFV